MTDDVLGGVDWRTDLFDVDGYLSAIGVATAPPSLKLLGELHHAHVHTFPFANIDVLLGTHPGVAPNMVQEQLVRRRRGGYCFEHAQIFAAALEYLGFTVRRAFGRVHSLTNNRSHMSVTAQLDGRCWLCDPGFGFSLTGPIELVDGSVRTERPYTFGIARTDDTGEPVWEFTRDGEVQHYIDELPVHPVDVRSAHFVTSRKEHSGFLSRLVVARHLHGEHVTVTESHRTVRSPGRGTTRESLTVDEVMNEIELLGIVIDPGELEVLAEVVARLRTGTGY